MTSPSPPGWVVAGRDAGAVVAPGDEAS